MYLRDRRAVVLNHNPFMAFADDARPEYNRQVRRHGKSVATWNNLTRPKGEACF